MIVKYSRETSKSAANTGLAKVAVHCSADTFVVKIATFAKPETVSKHYKDRQQTTKQKQK